ncbi:MAG: hypothetical protein N2554_06225, partial [Fimbriimonadales bacterium]|nr:hypothetical protein [Fimbriimonadales bacterium]
FLKVDKIGAVEPWEPSFYAIAEGCDVVGEYIDTGLPSLAVCDHRTWKAVFLGERRLTPELVRSLVRWAGGHIWLDTNDLVQARYPWVHVHARKGGARTLQFPMPLSVYDTTESELVAESVMEHTLYLQEGESRLLLAAPHEQLLKLLQGEPIELEPYFQLIETPAEPEPAETPAPVPEPDWEEPVLEPIALEESPFEPIEAETLSEETPMEESVAPVAPSDTPPPNPRSRKRARNNRRGKPARPTKQETAPRATPAETPIIAVQWRRTSEES